MSNDRQLEALLRDGMAAEARPVVAESRLTEQIIASATAESRPADPRSWQNWLLPAVAAVLVALLLGSVLFGAKLLHSAGQSPAGHHTPPPTPSFSSNPGPSGSPTQSAPSTKPDPSGGNTGVVSPGTGPVPDGFSGYDLTWISQDEGWALGTAPCSTAPCTSIVHTLDGGQTWGGLPAPSAFLAQSDVCSSDCERVSGIRFANAEVGYVYGPNSFWTTTDGGRNWSHQSGNAWALEVVAGRVLRVSGADPNCAPGCRFVAATGCHRQRGLEERCVAQRDPECVGHVERERQQRGPGHLWQSGRRGRSAPNRWCSSPATAATAGTGWAKLCPQSGGEADSTAVTVAADGSLAALCQPRTPPAAPAFLVTSTDGGQHFSKRPAVPGTAARTVAATSPADVLVGGDRLYRWDGTSWHTVAGPDKPRFVGFESTDVGRLLAANGAWTTNDGGLSWSRLSY